MNESAGTGVRTFAACLRLVVAVLAFVFGSYLLLGRTVVFGSALDVGVSQPARGFLASILLAVIVGWYLAARREPCFPRTRRPPAGAS